jgi:hypothetical protein
VSGGWLTPTATRHTMHNNINNNFTPNIIAINWQPTSAAGFVYNLYTQYVTLTVLSFLSKKTKSFAASDEGRYRYPLRNGRLRFRKNINSYPYIHPTVIFNSRRTLEKEVQWCFSYKELPTILKRHTKSMKILYI